MKQFLLSSLLTVSVASVAFSQDYDPYSNAGISPQDHKYLLQKEWEENVDGSKYYTGYIYNDENTRLLKIEYYTQNGGKKYILEYAELEYDAKGRIKAKIAYQRDPESEEDPGSEAIPFVPESRITYTYNEATNQLISLYIENWKPDDDGSGKGEYLPHNKYELEYSEGFSKPTKINYYIRVAQGGDVQYLYTDTYTYVEKIEKVLTVKRDGNNLDDKIKNKRTYYYQGDNPTTGKCTHYIDEKFNGTDWEDFRKVEYTYDGNDNVKTQVNSIIKRGAWTLNFKYEYDYDTNKLHDEVYTFKDWTFYGGLEEVYQSKNVAISKKVNDNSDYLKTFYWEQSPNASFLATTDFVAKPSLSVQLYPNPVVDYFSLQGLDHQSANLFIYDRAGRVVKQTTTDSEGRYDVRDLKAGVYFVVVKAGALSKSIKLIKK
ncbi:T9SS type A sorting domain-containing protein [Bergeyella cardium]|uniref:T9SS type A sorting domain-containing protein n=1 Tax=Bergeyella cardium TaxID=1585976 RepID=UPI000EA39225|nr:T9SS type A sorting domain-containing protein [Bergeyella cardium]